MNIGNVVTFNKAQLASYSTVAYIIVIQYIFDHGHSIRRGKNHYG